MSPTKRKPLLRALFSSHLACGCGATRPSHRNVYQPKPRPKPKSSSSSSNDGDNPPTTLDQFGPSYDHLDKEEKKTMILSPNGGPMSKIEGVVSPSNALSCSSVGESIAVVKESKDPYEDFKHSMLQMIFENQMYSTEELHQLLRCFLRLNSPAHHHIILRAFFQVCDAVVSSSSNNVVSNK